MPFLPVLIKLKSRESHCFTCDMKDKTSVFFIYIFSLLAQSQTCFDTIVRVLLIMLRKNTRNNIGGMRVCERDQHSA